MILFCEILLSFYLNFNFVSCALIQYNELILEDANLLVVSLMSNRINIQFYFLLIFSQI